MYPRALTNMFVKHLQSCLFEYFETCFVYIHIYISQQSSFLPLAAMVLHARIASAGMCVSHMLLQLHVHKMQTQQESTLRCVTSGQKFNGYL